MMADVLKLVIANGCLLGAGAGLTRAAGLWAAPAELRRVVATSFVAGVAAYGVIAQMLYVAGFALTRTQALVVCGTIACAGLVTVAPASRPPVPPLRPLEWLAGALVAVPLLLLATAALFEPLSSWDAWTQWTPKASALVLLGGLDSDVFTGSTYSPWHLDYPLLIPAVEAFTFRFAGVKSSIAHLESVVVLAGFAGSLVELLRPRVDALLAWSAVLALVWTPKIGAETLSANADVPLAIFVVLAGIAAWLWVSDGEAWSLILFGLFAAGALASKLEGTPEIVVVASLAIVAAMTRGASGRAVALALASAAAFLFGLAPWRLWLMRHDIPATYAAGSVVDTVRSLEPARLPISVLELAHQLFIPSAWILLLPLALCAVLAAVVSRRPSQAVAGIAATTILVIVGLASALALPGHSFEWRPEYWLLFIPGVVAGLAFVVAAIRSGGVSAYLSPLLAAVFSILVGGYVFTPYDFAWHIGTSASRVVLPIGLLAVAFAPLVLGDALGRADASNAGRLDTRPTSPGGLDSNQT